MSWMSLKRVLKCLLAGSPLLEKLSLVSLPCPLDIVLLEVLIREHRGLQLSAGSTDPPPVPLGRIRHINLSRTDVEMITVRIIIQQSKRLKSVDVSHCWRISQLQWLDCKKFNKVEIVWL